MSALARRYGCRARGTRSGAAGLRTMTQTEPSPRDSNPGGNAPNGLPKGADEAESKGTPTSDREKSESGPHES